MSGPDRRPIELGELRGEEADDDAGRTFEPLGAAPLSGAVVSPDGRWMVRRLLGRVEVVDVLDGQSTVVLNLSLGRGDSIIWIENR